MERTTEPTSEFSATPPEVPTHVLWVAQRGITRHGASGDRGLGVVEMQQLPNRVIDFIGWLADGWGSEEREKFGAAAMVQKYLFQESMETDERERFERWYDEWELRKRAS